MQQLYPLQIAYPGNGFCTGPENGNRRWIGTGSMKNLQEMLRVVSESGESSRRRKRADAIKKLLGKLDKTEARIRRQIDAATSADEKSMLKRKLLVCVTQRSKGVRALNAGSNYPVVE
jgi:hypothetical protein